MARAKFTYTLEEKNGTQFICIVDVGRGAVMSVTNDIENVVSEICSLRRISRPQDFVFIYQDSEGIWDEWSHIDQDFNFLGARSKEEAIDNLLLKQGSL